MVDFNLTGVRLDSTGFRFDLTMETWSLDHRWQAAFEDMVRATGLKRRKVEEVGAKTEGIVAKVREIGAMTESLRAKTIPLGAEDKRKGARTERTGTATSP